MFTILVNQATCDTKSMSYFMHEYNYMVVLFFKTNLTTKMTPQTESHIGHGFFCCCHYRYRVNFGYWTFELGNSIQHTYTGISLVLYDIYTFVRITPIC